MTVAPVGVQVFKFSTYLAIPITMTVGLVYNPERMQTITSAVSAARPPIGTGSVHATPQSVRSSFPHPNRLLEHGCGTLTVLDHCLILHPNAVPFCTKYARL